MRFRRQAPLSQVKVRLGGGRMNERTYQYGRSGSVPPKMMGRQAAVSRGLLGEGKMLITQDETHPVILGPLAFTGKGRGER